jgi:hypothetical protein
VQGDGQHRQVADVVGMVNPARLIAIVGPSID